MWRIFSIFGRIVRAGKPFPRPLSVEIIGSSSGTLRLLRLPRSQVYGCLFTDTRQRPINRRRRAESKFAVTTVLHARLYPQSRGKRKIICIYAEKTLKERYIF